MKNLMTILILMLVSCTKNQSSMQLPPPNCGVVVNRIILAGGNQINPAGSHQMYLIVSFDRGRELDTIPIGIVDYDRDSIGSSYCK